MSQLDRLEGKVDDIKVLLCGTATDPGGMVQQVHDHDEWIRGKVRLERVVVAAGLLIAVSGVVAVIVAMIRMTPPGG